MYSVHASKFQMPAHYISLCRDTGDVHFVVRGTSSMADALTDGAGPGGYCDVPFIGGLGTH